MICKKLNEYQKKIEKLKGEYSFGRLGKTFKTEKNYYFYDTGTGKVAIIQKDMYIVLNLLFKNKKLTDIINNPFSEEKLCDIMEEIFYYIKKENILMAKTPETFINNATVNIEQMLQNSVSSITLEVTEKCNLRCKYCIYHPSHPNFREFGKRDMNLDTAKRAVDFLKEHSSNEKSIRIGFYGGEPLIKYDIIKCVILYSEEKFEGKELIFSLTSNGCLLNKEMADFFVAHNVNIVFSLDGPQDIHDENRILVDGTGSFKKTIQGIEIFSKTYTEAGKIPNIGINIVTSPPDYEKKYTRIQEFLESCDWFGEHIAVTCSTVDYGVVEEEYRLPQSDEEEKRKMQVYDPLDRWSKECTLEGEKLFSEPTFVQGLLRIHRRTLTKEPVEDYWMNGCCVPGSRKAFITIDGDILPCERVGTIPFLGNIWEGFNVEKIHKNYIEDYINSSIPKCRECWAVNLCSLCYMNMYDKEKIHPSYRNIECIQERMHIENDLMRYHTILETDPDYLDQLDNMNLI